MNAFALMLCAATAAAANETPNFVATATNPGLETRIARTAEQLRTAMAIEWLGQPLPDWSKPCRITIDIGDEAAGGSTTYQFNRGEVFGWKMQLAGPRRAILADHLPHEIMHTILASQFRRPVDQWVSEGLARSMESAPRRAADLDRVREAVQADEQLSLRDLMSGDETEDAADLMGAQSMALVLYLQHLRGRSALIRCITTARTDGWSTALQDQYGVENLDELEQGWIGWMTGRGVRRQTSPGRQSTTGLSQDGKILFFMAKWCGPCQKMQPLIGRLQREGYPIMTVDIDKNRDLATRYGVTSIPTFLGVDGRTEQVRLTGLLSEQRLRRLFDGGEGALDDVRR